MQRLDLDLVAEMADDPNVSGQEFVERLRDALGVGHIAFMMIRVPGVVIHKSNFGFSTYSSEWLAAYVSKGYWMHDPAIKLALKRASAFSWDEAEITPALATMLADAAAHKISPHGFTIPIHGPQQETSILSVSAKWETNEFGWKKDYKARLIRDLIPVAAILHDIARKELGIGMDSDPSMMLSNAEREALSWASLGKTAWETAKILGKSKKTVEFQLAACRDKLGAVTTAHAVTLAVAGGLIEDQSEESKG